MDGSKTAEVIEGKGELLVALTGIEPVFKP